MNEFKHYLAFDSLAVKKLVSVFDESEWNLRIIGGCVRDMILGVDSYDIDFVTNAKPDQIIKILKDANIKFVPTGIKYGTISAIINQETFEITTLRSDIECYGRDAHVEFVDNFELDALRRDFTINALSYDPIKHVIYDYCNGLNDLENKQVRFIGDPDIRVKEDYLRILRFFRFSCRFADINNLDKNSLNACIKHKESLRDISRYRINGEMDKILDLGENMIDIIDVMYKHGILYCLFPVKEFDSELFKLSYILSNKINFNIELVTYYAFILSNELDYRDLVKLGFSKAKAKKIYNIWQFYIIVEEILCRMDFDENIIHQNIRLNIIKSWLDDYEQYEQNIIFLLTSLSYKNKTFNNKFVDLIIQIVNELKNRKKPMNFPLNGNILIEEFAISKKLVGEYLEKAKNYWILNNFEPDISDILKWLKSNN